MQDYKDELDEETTEPIIQITITTPHNQIRTFKGTPDALRLNDWNSILEGIIDSEEKYAETD